MEHLNPVDQARQLAAEVVKRLGQLNLQIGRASCRERV